MRNRSRSRDRLSSRDADALQKQPMFCMETAINMFYWSVLVYDHEEVRALPKPHTCHCTEFIALEETLTMQGCSKQPTLFSAPGVPSTYWSQS